MANSTSHFKMQKVNQIKGRMDSVDIILRVIEIEPKRTVKAKNGEWVLREVIAGDETGRIKVVLWGEGIGASIKQGDIIKIENGWTTVFNNRIELNVGSKSKITVMNENNNLVPPVEQIPNVMEIVGGEYRVPLRKKKV